MGMIFINYFWMVIRELDWAHASLALRIVKVAARARSATRKETDALGAVKVCSVET